MGESGRRLRPAADRRRRRTWPPDAAAPGSHSALRPPHLFAVYSLFGRPESGSAGDLRRGPMAWMDVREDLVDAVPTDPVDERPSRFGCKASALPLDADHPGD